MSEEQGRGRLTRREFLRRAAAGAAVAAGALSGLAKLPAVFAGTAPRAQAAIPRRTLGRTKLKVSVLGMGTIRTGNPAVIQKALDLGINFFDTAECYRNGNSEIDLGKALRGRRDQAIVATKWHVGANTPARDLIASLEGSLKRLNMDHVDIVQIHGAGDVGQVENPAVWEAFSKLREQGKVRFNGFTTHSSSPALLRAAVKTGWYDTVLPIHNALTAERTAPWVAEARGAGLGVIAMKALQPAHEGSGSDAFASLKGSPYQKAIRWVVSDENVSTVIVDMPTFSELEENVAAVTTPVERAELEQFEKAVAQIAPGTCHLCGECTQQCQAGVRVSDIMRYVMYHDAYGHRERAISLYRALPEAASAAACRSCPECRVVCPWGVAVRPTLEYAHARMA